MSYALSPAAHIAPQIAPPEHAVSEAGCMPASSKARATPISDTHAPPPPVAITATRLSASAGTGRGGGTPPQRVLHVRWVLYPRNRQKRTSCPQQKGRIGRLAEQIAELVRAGERPLQAVEVERIGHHHRR